MQIEVTNEETNRRFIHMYITDRRQDLNPALNREPQMGRTNGRANRSNRYRARATLLA